MATTLSIQLNNLLNTPMFEKDAQGNLMMTWAWKQIWIGMAGPTTNTIATAKLTPGGDEGSISYNDYGLITEVVPAT